LRPERPNIALPEFPARVEAINAPFVRMSTLLGRSVVLVWFWDCCSLNSLRALPYLREWHHRYAGPGLGVIGVHSPQFEFGKRQDVVEEAVRRHEIQFAVALDPNYEIWRLYGNEMWPALYLADRRGILRYYHFGEGEYEETERAIGELLREIDPELELPEPMAPLRATDRPGALVRAPTPHRYLREDRSAQAFSAGEELGISYQGAGAVAVLDGEGEVELLVDGKQVRTLTLDGPRLYELVNSSQHEEHELTLRFRDEALAYAFSFVPGPA
jgi:Thioredoxin like C-terminal domain/AhpC/TSA family